MTSTTLSRGWDEYDVYLFDIDGTLLNCTDAVHYFAFCDTLTRIAGYPLNLDGVVAHGNTDLGILRDALNRAGIQESRWRCNLPQLRADMGRFVQQRRSELMVSVLPGVPAVLHHLRSNGALLGVATGNLKQIGELKLAHCDLLRSFDFGAFSDEHEHRADVFASAIETARALRGPNATICVIGDTPADIQAAHSNGVEVIAVATGIYPHEQLQAEDPELCISSLQSLLKQPS